MAHGIPPIPKNLDLSSVLYCLSDPIRLSIVKELDLQDDLECGTFTTSVAKSTLTHHFKVLRETGVIKTTKNGTKSLNRLRRDEINAAFPGLLEAILNGAKTTVDSLVDNPKNHKD